jgi:hypothetical protein
MSASVTATEGKAMLPRVLGIVGLSAAFLAWLVPVFMLPFVNVLPYLHTTALSHRLGWSAAFYAVVCLIARAVITRQQWNAVRRRTFQGWKNTLGVLLGLLMAVYAAASLSANTLGLIVKALPGEHFSRDFVVTMAKTTGSNFKAVELELQSPSNQHSYEITLSNRPFGTLPTFKPGDLIRFEGTQNLFGSYVSHVTALTMAE